jgi:hypothetical protein
MKTQKTILVKFWDCPNPKIFFFYTDDERLCFEGLVDYYISEGSLKKKLAVVFNGWEKAPEEQKDIARNFVMRKKVAKVSFWKEGFELHLKEYEDPEWAMSFVEIMLQQYFTSEKILFVG